MSTPDDEVNIAAASRRVWLVKVPNFLADSWKKLPPESELGRVSIATKGPNTEINLNIAGAYSTSLPKEYSLVVTPVTQPMQIISEDEATGALTMEGTVKHKGDLKPAMQADYRNLIRQRNEAAQQKKRKAALYTNEREMTAGREKGSRMVSTTLTGNKRPKPVRASSPSYYDKKHVRSEKPEAIERLLKMFEVRDFWTLTELKAGTEQPMQFLKELLNEYCLYHKRGPSKSMYQLKPEYQTSRTGDAPVQQQIEFNP